MKTNETKKEQQSLFKSLAAFQQEVPVIHKETKGYGYSYADLPTIFDKINPLLQKHNLGFTQPIMGNCVKTIVFQTETGETIESLTEIPQGVQLKGMNDFQVLGSAITYIRRYALSSILGLVTDKDTDAAGEQTKPSKPILKADTEHFGKAVEYLMKGGSIDAIKAKYEVSNEVEVKLLKSI
ncbi:MAG: hypothetical protein RIR01_2472 [Bacteroidota bacterium]|jgi:hypothetical protein